MGCTITRGTSAKFVFSACHSVPHSPYVPCTFRFGTRFAPKILHFSEVQHAYQDRDVKDFAEVSREIRIFHFQYLSVLS